MKHRIQLTAILLTAIIAGGFAFSALALTGDGTSGLYITDFSDDRKLVGTANNVFVGRVLEQINQTSGTASDARYAVRVLMNIKGNLRDSIVVRIYKGGQGLNVGSTYVIAALYSPTPNWYVIGAVFDRKQITDDSTLTDMQLKQLAEGDERVRALQVAYTQEITYANHVTNGTDYNSYATRCLDANGELIDDTVQLAREKQGLPKTECVTPLKVGEPSPGWIETGAEAPKAGQKFLLAFAALVILAAAGTVGYVIRLAVKQTA